MKNLQELKNELLKKPGFREEYYKKDDDFEIAQMVMRARVLLGLTQEELARRVGTKQPSIARLESGSSTTSLKLLRAVADALNLSLEIHFLDMRGVGINKYNVEHQMDQSTRGMISVAADGTIWNDDTN